MRIYQLHLIVEEFASHFFGRERLFFHLFKEYDKAFGEKKHILEKQIRFITKPIKILKIKRHMRLSLQRNKCFYANKGTYYIDINKRSFAQLEMTDRCIVIRASGNYEAETIFFEVLRKCEPSFLAIDSDRQRCAWLKPIKERKFV